MKIQLMSIALCLLFLCSNNCIAQTVFDTKLLPDNANYSYIWYKNNQPFGDSVFSIKKEANGNYLIKTSGVENTIVEVHGSNLKPIKAERFFNMNNKKYFINSTFNQNKATISAELPTGLQNATVDVPDNVYHNDSLLMSLMAIPMQKEKIISFKHFNPSNANIANYKVTIVGVETVKVPAGDFETYHLKLNYSNGLSIHDAWYQKALPHKLIKYINNDAKTTAKLSK